MHKIRHLIVSLGSAIAAIVFLGVSPAHAISLYVSPSAGSFTVGSTFTASIFVDTEGKAVNAVQAELTFPADKLQVVSPSTGQSFITTWIAQPTYSNTDGMLDFQGALPSPGITTGAGLVSTVTFRVKSTGTATIKFTDHSRVLLNDGLGTDALDGTSGSIYALVLPPPAGPIVVSRTDPDQNQWYPSQTVSFEWTAPSDIQGYSYVLDDNPDTIPSDVSNGTGTRVTYNNVADGVHYFHIKSLRQNVWGGATDYAVKIDSSLPAGFQIEIIPSAYTSDLVPIVSFATTDAFSGIDHYELAIISLDQNAGGGAVEPFFIETDSPYVAKLAVGRYNVIVRAYDKTGNYMQEQAALTIVNPIFKIFGTRGIGISGFTLGWPYAGSIAAILLIILFLFARWVWRLHREVEEHVRHGALAHPSIAPKIDELKAKQEEYGSSDAAKKLMIAALAFLAGLAFLTVAAPHASAAATDNISGPEPPVITLYPPSISNDEILYIGGQANVPGAQVLLYLENADTKATTEKTVLVDANGNWFYSFPNFMDSGHYIAWAQLQSGAAQSPPSSQAAITVAPTALQIGTHRLDLQDLYLLLAIIFLAAFVILLGVIVYHGYQARRKNRRLQEEIRNAEESVRRGFAVLRRDIEDELATIHKAKMNKELTAEEKTREEKLLKDLEEITGYVGKEIWELEQSGK